MHEGTCRLVPWIADSANTRSNGALGKKSYVGFFSQLVCICTHFVWKKQRNGSLNYRKVAHVTSKSWTMAPSAVNPRLSLMA